MAVDVDVAAPLDLLPLALSRPGEAVDRARALLGGHPTPEEASVAHQAIGVVWREFGDIDAALSELRSARRFARRSGSADREADVLGTLGVTFVFAGRTASGRRTLNAAVDRSTGLVHGRNLFRRGATLLILGDHEDALRDLQGAVRVLRAAGDVLWEARARTDRGFAFLALGSVSRARADLERAQGMFTATGQVLESIDAIVHLGLLALRIGDLPAALSAFDDAADRFRELGIADISLSRNRCDALLAAGLPREALAEADAAIARSQTERSSPARRAELVLAGAVCALAAGEPERARDRAVEAVRLFSRQGRPWWGAHARLARVRATFATGPPTALLLRDAQRCAADLHALSSPDAVIAQLLAGRIALALGRPDAAREHLAAAALARRRGAALSRAVGWLAEALQAEVAGDRRRLLIACRRGLDIIDEYRGALGSSELRAQATMHGAELSSLGQRHALAADRPRQLLTWSERWRASALAVPPVRPPDDARAQADLAALRDVTSRLARGHADRLPTAALHREQLRLERAVRARALRARGAGRPDGSSGVDVARVLDELGDDRLLELVDIDGRLHVLVCGSGTVRRVTVGPTAQAARDVEFARSALTRLAFGLSADPDRAMQRLDGIGRSLQRLLLGQAVDHLGHGVVTVVPPGRLHAVPWALLPALRSRVLNVAPSAATWLRARRDGAGGREGGAGGRVVLVRGPGLESDDAEISQLAADYGASGEPVVLGGGTATVARVLAAMDGAELVHIAAHGSFRADSPLFSALRLDDGPLTVYDLEGLRRAPHRIVLSSCDSGVSAHAGADELLGLIGALIPLGTVGIVASIVPVNDAAVARVMTELHRELRRGSALAEALCDARRSFAADPVDVVTSYSFLSLGCG